MSKQLTCQRQIFKIHSARLRKAKWNLTLPLSEARNNDELVSLSDSQILRWIDEINGIEDADATAREIKRQIKAVRKRPSNLQNRRELKRLYADLDRVQFKPDYLCVIMDKEKDYWRARKGFKVNGIRYVRLLGTNGGIKNSTIVFVSDRLAPELRKRIDNGRDKTVPLVAAKLEAYMALVCSGSTPVSMPHGIAVVPDCITHFKSDVININDEQAGEPVMEFEKDADVELDNSDGFGLMLPSLAERWSEELKLGYTTCGVNTRFSFEKGMIFTFDFVDFADKVAGTRIIKDVWGNEVDVGNVELILTESMLKLWSSYKSLDDYLYHCEMNHYTFGIPKVCPKELEKQHTTNYQFIQCLELNDEDIEELIQPTIQNIHDVIRGDWRKSVLFLEGVGLNEENVEYLDDGFAKAIMIDRRVIDDTFVQKKILDLIKKRITDAKIGVLDVHANYSVLSGDPYALCQSMFGLPVTGLLGAGEIYNQFWLDSEAPRVSCFRAPMTVRSNIVPMEVSRSEEAQYWFRYMDTCTVLNTWDTAAAALNGADKDGDLVFLTDNPVIVRRTERLPALMCAQRKADKCIPTEDDIIQSNINSFGDDIGKITNRATSMYNVLAQFEPGTKEYEVLDYRIKCSQLFQQNSIDKAKGIVAKPMPRTWYDRDANRSCNVPDDAERQFNLSIVADKKPYFMRYIYPALMKQYNTYISNTSRKCVREFRLEIDELLAIAPEDRSPEQENFIYYYYAKMPVGINDCVMNRICRRFEEEFDGYIAKHKGEVDFDYDILKSGQEYTTVQFDAISKLYKEYNQRQREYARFATENRVSNDERIGVREEMMDDFRRECYTACSNARQLCDILLDVCYKRQGSKQMVWDMATPEIIDNLLEKNDYYIAYPVRDENGDVEYGGERYTFALKQLGGVDSVDYFERERICGDGAGELCDGEEAG